MPTPIRYEWDVETYVEYADTNDEDIIEHSHADTAAEALRAMHEPKPDPEGVLMTRLVLVRDALDEDGWVADRSWAYVEDGQLPEAFDDGHVVPQRFHRELARALS